MTSKEWLKVNLGRYNPRAINPTQVTKLAKEFVSKGISSATRESAIVIAFRPTWLKATNTLAKDLVGATIEKLPTLELSAEGEKALREGEICGFGGQHRRAALRQAIAKNELELAEAKTELKDLEDEDDKAKVEVQESIARCTATIAKCKGYEALFGPWTIRAINKGMWYIFSCERIQS